MEFNSKYPGTYERVPFAFLDGTTDDELDNILEMKKDQYFMSYAYLIDEYIDYDTSDEYEYARAWTWEEGSFHDSIEGRWTEISQKEFEESGGIHNER
jgi:hypothetical protein